MLDFAGGGAEHRATVLTDRAVSTLIGGTGRFTGIRGTLPGGVGSDPKTGTTRMDRRRVLVREVATDRLLLRPWREDDGVDLQRLFSDAAVRGERRMLPDRIARLHEGSLQQWHTNGFGPWAAIDKATGNWIGRVGLDELDGWPGADRIEVGFELHAAWWGRGLASEATRAALAFGFERHGLDRIISVTAAAHAAARRVMEKAGLTYQGTRYWMSRDVPVVWYAIDRAVWQARHSTEEAR